MNDEISREDSQGRQWPRVVISGMGSVSPLGLDVPTFWQRLSSGQSGIGPLEKIDASTLRNPNGGEVRGFDWSLWGEEGDCDEATGFAFAAAHEAASDAHLSLDDLSRAGLVLGTNFGGAASWEMTCEMLLDAPADPEGDPNALPTVDAETFRQFSPEHALGYISERLGLGGPRLSLSNACSSGAHALGLACDWLRLGRAEIVLCGGYDGLGLSTLAGLSILRTISPDACRPFDLNRSGTIFGEGAAILVLETWESALKRDAKVYAEVLGHAINNNAHHLTAPDKDGRGLESVMLRALRDAGIGPSEIDYINAHGTGTQYNDLAETQAIKRVLGERARQVPVSSIKAATSHTMGAAGALEAIACVLALQNQTLPPTLNYETPDPACDLDIVPNKGRSHAIRTVLSNSSGIGGNNASVVLRIL
jgi:3-oxoacyl-[acyl-carrier-protein] synthase II